MTALAGVDETIPCRIDYCLQIKEWVSGTERDPPLHIQHNALHSWLVVKRGRGGISNASVIMMLLHVSATD